MRVTVESKSRNLTQHPEALATVVSSSQTKPIQQLTRHRCRRHHRHRRPFERCTRSSVKAPCMIKCVLLNARSICNKLPELYQLLYGEMYDVILITESWLNSNIGNSLIDPHNLFTIVRRDRAEGSVGGGTCALIRKPLSVVEVM